MKEEAEKLIVVDWTKSPDRIWTCDEGERSAFSLAVLFFFFYCCLLTCYS